MKLVVNDTNEYIIPRYDYTIHRDAQFRNHVPASAQPTRVGAALRASTWPPAAARPAHH